MTATRDKFIVFGESKGAKELLESYASSDNEDAEQSEEVEEDSADY